MPKDLIPFGPLAPDDRDRDTDRLEKADNALPVFFSYRSLQQLNRAAVGAAATIAANINSLFAHFYTKLVGEQVAYPIDNANNSDGTWEAVGGSEDDTDLYQKIDNAGPDDATRMVAAGAPVDATALIKLSNLQTPDTTKNTLHDLKFRYKITGVSGTWTLDVSVVNDGPGAATPIDTDSLTDTADTDGWVDVTYDIDSAWAAAMHAGGDWDDLWLKFVATVPGDGDQVGYPTDDYDNRALWTDETGSLADLYASLGALDDATYAVTPGLKPGDSVDLVVDLDELEDPVIHTGHVLTWRVKAGSDNINMEVTLEEEGDVIATGTLEGVPNSFASQTLTLTAAEAALIKNYGNLKLRIRAYVDEDVTTTVSSTDFYPNRYIRSSGPWVGSNAGVVADAGNNSDTVSETTGAANQFIEWGIAASDPGTDKNHVITVKAKGDAATTNGIWVAMDIGGSQIIDGSGTAGSNVRTGASINPDPAGGLTTRFYCDLATSYRTFTYTLSEAEAARITNYSTLELTVFNAGGQATTIEKAYLQLDDEAKAYISMAKWDVPDEARCEISQANVRVPSSYESQVGDLVEVYCGTENKLFQVSEGGFTDLSRTTALGPPHYQNLANPIADDEEQTSYYAHSWDFCSWGSKVIATNWTDPVQKKDPADSAFSDLLAGQTQRPRSRFVATVANFVVLANLNFDADVDGDGTLDDGEGDELWWSKINDATVFTVGVDANQSDRQRLFSTPGQITGIVGGEYGVVFKATSIYRMDYVGSPLIFSFDLVSVNEGTKFWRSIVPVGNDIYFYGNGSFRVLRDGQTLDRIGDGQITKTIIDEQFEARAMEVVSSDGGIEREREKDATIVGTYDRLSGLIYWSYRRKGDDAFRNTGILIYNPVEDRWGYATDSAMRFAAIGTLPLSDDVGDSLTRNVMSIWMGLDSDSTTYDAEYRFFNGLSTYAATFETKILSSAAITRTQSMVRTNITIGAVRLIYSADSDIAETGVSIKVECGDEQLLQDNVQEDTVTFDDADEDGWMAIVPMSGEFFRFTVTVPALKGKSIKQFDGIQVVWTATGEY